MSRDRSSAAAAAFALLASAASLHAQFLISEFSASNRRVIRDRYGDASDWIEIINISDQTADLAGWRLTDNAANLAKWTFPPTNIPPGQCIVVFASDRNRVVPGEELHTNFELKKDGEYLALVRPNGAIAHEFSPAFPAQVADVSYGILPGGTTNVVLGTNTAYRYVVPTSSAYDGAWLWWEFNDASWSNGVGIAGYDTNNVYRPLIQTSVSNLMHTKQVALYIRAPFVVDRPTTVRSMTLEVSIDDGFIAYLNGSEIARTNIGSGVPVWNTAASTDITTNALAGSTRFPISRASRRLVQGTNWFCLHAANRAASNADVVVRFLLRATTDAAVTGVTAYSFFAPPSPGLPNDITRSIRGPLIEWATDSAVNVQTGATIAVTARVAQTFHPVVTNQVKAFWRVMYGGETEVVLRDDGTGGDPVAGDGIYHGAIPTTALGTNQMIRWRFEARDVSNNVSRLPSFHDFADSPEYFGAVAVDPALNAGIPVFHWFCQSTSTAETEMGTRASVYFLSNFYDNVGIDLHGQSSSGFPLKSHNFDFNSGQRFLYMPGQRKVADIDILSTWADKSKCRVTISYGSFAAFGHPTHFAFPVRVHRNGAFHGIFDMVEDADDRYLARNGLSENGALYKMYNSLTDWWPGTPGSGSGAEKKNRRDEGNADLKELVQSLGLAGAPLAQYVFDNVDVCRAVNYFAIMAIMQDHDHGHKNYYLYRDTTGDQRWSILPQDADLTFGHVWSNTNPAGQPASPAYFDLAIRTNNSFPFNYTGNRLFAFMMTNAVTKEMFLRRVRTLLDRTLAPGQTFYQNWIGALTNQLTADYADYYAKWKSTPWGPQTNWETMVEEANRIIEIYIPGRYEYITNRPGLPPSQPSDVAVVFGRLDVSPAGGNQDQEFIEIINTNGFAVDISDWSLSNAVTFVFGGGTVIPAGGSLFVSPNTLAFRQRATSPRSNEMALATSPYRGRLSSWGETVELWNEGGAMVAATNYPSNPSAWQRHLRVTEIMYQPTDPPDGSPYGSNWEFEWVELANFGTNDLDLAGVAFTEGITFRFTNSLALPPGGRVVVARNVAAFASRYATNGVLVAGNFTDLLDNSGEKLKLEDPNNDTILEFRYEGSWSAAADGRGASLVHTNPAASHTDWGNPADWIACPVWQGTPGRGEPEWPPETVVVNEWMAHSDVGDDWIEIRNLGGTPLDIGGWWLSDSLQTLRKFVLPSPTVLPAGGFAVFGEAQFNNTNHPGCIVPFALSELGEEIHLTAATNGVSMAYRHSVLFEASDRNVSFARHVTSDGRTLYPAASEPTPGAPNALPRVGPVVISELLYAPAPGGMEYVELYVPTNALVPMFDPAAPTNVWRLSAGISFWFPTGSVLTGLQYALVVGSAPETFRASNAIPPHVPVFGPFSGALDNSGERIRLRKPGSPEPDGSVPYIAIDEIEYGIAWPWPAAGRIGGRSIEKIHPRWFGNDPAHWRAGLPGGTPAAGLSDGDADGDGVPDEWELAHFGDTGPVEPEPDRDGDGRQDLWQFLDGSGVSNAAPPLALDWVQTAPPTAGFQARPAVGPGYQGRRRYYAVEASTSMAVQGWTPLAGHERIAADGRYVQITNSPVGLLNAIRVRAWLEQTNE